MIPMTPMILLTHAIALGLSSFAAAPAEAPPPSAVPEARPAPTSKLPGAAPVEPGPVAPALAEPAPEPAVATPFGPTEAVAPPVETFHWEKASPRWSPPSRPIRWRLDPFLELGTLTIVDRGYRALDDGRSPLQLGIGLRLDGRVGRGPLFLGGGLQYGHQAGEADPYDGALSTGVRANTAIASLRASVVLVEGIDVVAALEGGPQFVRARVDSNDRDTTSKRVLGTFAAKAGVSLYLPKAWLRPRGAARVTGGVTLMMGYGAGTKLRLRPRPDVADDAISTQGTSLGDVRMHGFVWSMGLFVRFM